MAHWAEIDENNIVLRVTVGDNNDPNGDEGYQWLLDNLGGRWIKTSYNNNIRKQFASIGYSYDQENDVFIIPQPFASWILNDTFDWVPPIEKPNEEELWIWSEEKQNWEKKEKPFDSWIMDESKNFWISPIDFPNDGKKYKWDEDRLSWIEILEQNINP
jgi:hypothetical protein